MRAGGGKEKGSAYEREVGRLLSRWLTYDERADIFSRNVLSGGGFTRAEQAGAVTSRMPGDLMPAHPLAFAFMATFSVECKHLRDIGLEAYLWDPVYKSPLAQIITLAERQAHGIGLHYFVTAKQNHRTALLFVSKQVGNIMMECTRRRGGAFPMYHRVHRQRVFIMRLEDMLAAVDPTTLLERLNV